VFISAVKGGADAMARSPPRVGSVLPRAHCTDCPTLARGSFRVHGRLRWTGARLPCFACHAPLFFVHKHAMSLTHARWHCTTPAKRRVGRTALMTMPFGYRADDRLCVTSFRPAPCWYQYGRADINIGSWVAWSLRFNVLCFGHANCIDAAAGGAPRALSDASFPPTHMHCTQVPCLILSPACHGAVCRWR
jgi:hypothetical protein